MPSPFDRLMATIRPHLPGAIDTAIKLELFQTCEEFLKKSEVWQEDLDFTVPYMGTEGPLIPTTGVIERLVTVRNPDESWVLGATMEVPGVVTLPYPNNGPVGSYSARVVMSVTDPVSVDAFPIMPADIVKRHTDTLISGILSKMMSQPSKPYTNLSLAQYHLLKFKGGSARARNDFNAKNTSGSQRWMFPQTFRV